jgi:hypothetical protein
MSFTIAKAMLPCDLITQNETNKTNQGISSAKVVAAFKVCMHYVILISYYDSDLLFNGQIDNYKGTCVRVLSKGKCLKIRIDQIKVLSLSMLTARNMYLVVYDSVFCDCYCGLKCLASLLYYKIGSQYARAMLCLWNRI